MFAIEVLLVGFFLVAILNLYSRLNTLEHRLEVTFKEIAERLPKETSATSQTINTAATAEQSTMASQPATQVSISSPVAQEDALIAWFKENWLLKLGALLILLAFGWLATYAFMNNWIGPAGRITLGLLGGTLLLTFGAWYMRTYVTQGAVFVALGAGAILLITYAARALYDFFDPLSALVLMFATSALVALISGVYNRKQLAVMSVVLAGVAPLLTHSPTTDYISLFAYLLAVVAGSVWLAFWRDFREVVATALVVVVLYGLPVLSGVASSEKSTLLLFVYAFAGMFYLTNTVGLLRLRGDAAVPDLATAAGNALFLLAWIYMVVAKEWQSLVIDAWAIVFVCGAFVIFRISKNKIPLFVYAGIGVAYIAASTAIMLHGSALVIAYTIESAIVALVLYALSRDVVAGLRASYLLAGPTALALPSMLSSQWSTSVFNEHFFVLGVLAATYLFLTAAFWSGVETSNLDDARNGRNVLVVVGSAVAYILLWLTLHAALRESPDTATMAALIVYTIIGISVYVQGVMRHHAGVQAYGGALLGFVVGRLLLVDVWQMALAGRIVTFFLIGGLFMSTAFLARGANKK